MWTWLGDGGTDGGEDGFGAGQLCGVADPTGAGQVDAAVGDDEKGGRVAPGAGGELAQGRLGEGVEVEVGGEGLGHGADRVSDAVAGRKAVNELVERCGDIAELIGGVDGNSAGLRVVGVNVRGCLQHAVPAGCLRGI